MGRHRSAGPRARPTSNAGMLWRGRHGRAGDSRFGAPIASHLSNEPLRANAANGVTGSDPATLLGRGPCRPQQEVEPGPCPMSTPAPRHLRTSRPRHLPTSRWPWRLLLVAVGLTTGVLTALVASAILPPQSSPLRRIPAFALATVPTPPAPKSVSTAPTGPRAPTTAPSRSTPTAATGPEVLSMKRVHRARVRLWVCVGGWWWWWWSSLYRLLGWEEQVESERPAGPSQSRVVKRPEGPGTLPARTGPAW